VANFFPVPTFPSFFDSSMVADQLHTLDDLEMRIRACGYNQFTGRLDLEIQNSGLQWSFFFYQGGLIWGTTKVHPVRRWWRQIAQYCPQLAIDSGQIGQQRSPNRQQSTQRNSQRNSQHNHQYYAQYIDHSAFVRLAQQGKVSPEQMTAVITGKLQEILFDLIQFGKQHGDRFKTQLVYGQLPKTIAASIFYFDSGRTPLATSPPSLEPLAASRFGKLVAKLGSCYLG
jgi:hypothetical protein